MTKHNDQLVTVKEAAEYLGVNVSTVQRWIQDGTLPVAQEIGGGEKRPALRLLHATDVEALRADRAEVAS